MATSLSVKHFESIVRQYFWRMLFGNDLSNIVLGIFLAIASNVFEIRLGWGKPLKTGGVTQDKGVCMQYTLTFWGHSRS